MLDIMTSSVTTLYRLNGGISMAPALIPPAMFVIVHFSAHAMSFLGAGACR